MKEEWKDIIGFEGFYQVSNLGRVKSLERKVNIRNGQRTVNERIMVGSITNCGYRIIMLCNNSKRKTFLVHRLVAILFVENILNKREVNHINGIKTDNRFGNLEWMSSSENQKHAFNNGLQISRKGQDSPTSKLTDDQILQIRNGHSGMLHKDIAKIYGVVRQTISAIKSKNRWKHIK